MVEAASMEALAWLRRARDNLGAADKLFLNTQRRPRGRFNPPMATRRCPVLQ